MLYRRMEKKLTWGEIAAMPGAVVLCVPCGCEGAICDGKHVPLPDGLRKQYMQEPGTFVPVPDAERLVALGAAVEEVLVHKTAWGMNYVAQRARDDGLVTVAAVFDAIAEWMEKGE